MTAELGTWDALKAWVEATYGELEDYGDGAILRFVVDGEGIGMRRLIAGTEFDWVFFGVKLGAASRLDAVTALCGSFDLPMGAIGMGGEFLFVFQKLPLSGLTPAVVTATVRTLIEQAAMIRALPSKDVVEGMGHYSE